MRNKIKKTKIGKIIAAVESLPLFSIENCLALGANKHYLKVVFSRYARAGKIVRLKKGKYVSKKFLDEIEKKGNLNSYSEFLVATLYRPSYLSLDYVLHQENILTEMPVNFTAVTTKKTASFSSQFGGFYYRKIKPSLFTGFSIIEKDGFFIYRAGKAKALFDFLYLRKNFLNERNSIEELRLNLSEFKEREKEELKKYCRLEGSAKMKGIYDQLFERNS